MDGIRNEDILYTINRKQWKQLKSDVKTLENLAIALSDLGLFYNVVKKISDRTRNMFFILDRVEKQ